MRKKPTFVDTEANESDGDGSINGTDDDEEKDCYDEDSAVRSISKVKVSNL